MEVASFITALPRSDAQQLAQTLKGAAAPRRRDGAARRVPSEHQVRPRRHRSPRRTAASRCSCARSIRQPATVHQVRDGRREDQGRRAERGQHAGGPICAPRSATRPSARRRRSRPRPSPRDRSRRSASTPPRRTCARRGSDDGGGSALSRAPIELDPKFGRAYSGLPSACSRLGNGDEADAAWKTGALADRPHDRSREVPDLRQLLPRRSPRTTRRPPRSTARWSTAYPADDRGLRQPRAVALLPARLPEGARRRRAAP